MNLYQQIAILVSTIFLMLFGIVLWVSFSVVSNNAQKALYENAQNSASSISLSIQNGGLNSSSIRTVITAAYDNGNYEKIVFKDTDGDIQYSIEKKEGTTSVPQWFDSLVSLDSTPSIATISSGWAILGLIEVYSDTELFKGQLYEIFWKLLIYLAFAYVIALSALHLFLRLILKPLKQIKDQAMSIMNNEFIINEKIPYAQEFRSVAKSMNAMTKKVEQIFDNANDALIQNRELLYVDQTTKLNNRRFFELKATEYIDSSGVFSSGSLIVIGVKNVNLLNRVIGYKNTDIYFKKLAQKLKKSFNPCPENLYIRLNGSEFITMLPGAIAADILPTVKSFYTDLLKEFHFLDIHEEDIDLYAGLCQYHDEKNISELFSKIDYTLTSAKLTSCQQVLFVKDDIPLNPKTQWRNIFKDAFINKNFTINYKPVLAIDSDNIFSESIHIAIPTTNKIYDYRAFIAPLIELHFMNEFYDYIFNAILHNPHQQAPLSIPLPIQYIQNDTSLINLKKFLIKNSNTYQNRIIFEIQESVLKVDLEKIFQLATLLDKYKCSIAIDNFIASTKDYNHFKHIMPIYIKTPKTFIQDNKQNISLMNILLNSINSKLVVTDIETDEDIKELKKHNILFYMYAMKSGPS